MATIREGNKSVLLIVDAQAGVVRKAWNETEVVANIALAVDRARQQGAPVLWVQNYSEELVTGSPEWQWADGLTPADGEPLFPKQFNSAFEQTGLEETLAQLGATHIVLAGAATNWCIRATAYAALDRGYDLTLLQDAHTSGDLELENGVKIDTTALIAELNNAMTRVGYPGRSNSTVAAADVAFAV